MTQSSSKTQSPAPIHRRGSSPVGQARACLLGAIVLTVGLPCVTPAADLLIRTRLVIEGSLHATEEVYHLTTGKKVVDADRQRTIIDYEHRTVTTLDKRDRTYRVVTFEELKRQIERMTDFMRRGLRRLSHERREGMGQAGFDPRARFTLRPTGRTERIAGHLAYELVLNGGPVTGSIWVGRDVRRPLEDRPWAPFMERFGGLDVMGSKFASAMARLDGWPLRTDLATPADVTVHSEVVEVRAEAPAAELLSVPAEYREADGSAAATPGAPAGRM